MDLGAGSSAEFIKAGDEVKGLYIVDAGTVAMPDGTTLAQAVGRRASSDIGSTLQALVTKRLLALGPDGYRVVSRAVARNLAGG